MNSELWQTLDRQLVVLVLARLPVPEIARLRCLLSEEWTMNLGFIRACDEANPNMAALLSYSLVPNEFSVRIFDFSRFVWLDVYRLRLIYRGNAPSGNLTVWKPRASDGGLVCFVSTRKYTKSNPLRILVINLLTQARHELPPLLNVYTVPPTLVHMKVDSATKAYKVFVVVMMGRYRTRGHHAVETYDSVSGQWSRAAPSWGRIWDRAFEYKRHRNDFRLKSSSLCTYDFQQRQLELWDFQSEGLKVMEYALAGDRLFVLHQHLNQPDVDWPRVYFITQFQSQNNATVWSEGMTDRIRRLEEEEKLFDLHGCEDVVVFRERLYNANQISCFLNFSTGEWNILRGNSPEDRQVSLVCRVFWNITP